MPPLPRLKTYLVEDSALIRVSLVATLEELVPIELVGTADDEAGALHWLPGRPRDGPLLLIVDLFLRAGSGLAVLRAVAALADAPRCVVLSNYATPEMRRRGLALGADRVFDKSQDIDELVSYCRGLAGAR